MFLFKSLITTYTAPLTYVRPDDRALIFQNLSTKTELLLSEKFREQSFEIVKRVTDICGALLLLVLMSPLLVVVALTVKMGSPGPAVFRQTRLTKNGKEFTMYKFRTMRADAESGTGAVWARKNDPRVTRVGRILRVSRLDELPQLVNVLKGDMSLIGPRPERPELVDRLSQEIPEFPRRMEVKAGITGLAQIANGYASSLGSYKRKIAFDVKYVESRSFSLDFAIALRTLVVILTGFGAK